MDFKEAFFKLKDGKSIRQADWKVETLRVVNGEVYRFTGISRILWNFNFNDFEYESWEVCD